MKYLKTYWPFLLIIILSLGTFWRMLRPGIFSMQDFHLFRLYEYDQCIKDLIFPCRWAPDAGLGYGEPLFNFYGQLAYLIGEAFHLIGFSLINSLKLTFILSLLGSSFTMYLLASYLWKNQLAALLSAIFYLYAPYRAVDVWVRGALPEALAFIFYPLVILFLLRFLKNQHLSDWLLFIFSYSLLIITHNLSAFMLTTLIIPLLLIKIRSIKQFLGLIAAGLFILLISSWYLLPVIFEQKYVLLPSIVKGYYYFENHWVTLYQLLISRVWGYSASEWGSKEQLSLSIGHLQWLVSIAILFLTFKKLFPLFKKSKLTLSRVKTIVNKAIDPLTTQTFIWFALAWFFLFLTHGKSNFIWQNLPGFKYLQFPWRWLGPALFSLSLLSGSLIVFIKNHRYQRLAFLLLALGVIGLSFKFFREDLWYSINDHQQFSGDRWLEQISSSKYDYWPIFGQQVPDSPAPSVPIPIFIQGQGQIEQYSQQSHSVTTQINVQSPQAKVEFPLVYFPGWKVTSPLNIQIDYSKKYGQILIKLPQGSQHVTLNFSNTLPRTIGNYLSLLAILVWISLYFYSIKKTKKTSLSV